MVEADRIPMFDTISTYLKRRKEFRMLLFIDIPLLAETRHPKITINVSQVLTVVRHKLNCLKK